jgi:hypothetical protein
MIYCYDLHRLCAVSSVETSFALPRLKCIGNEEKRTGPKEKETGQISGSSRFRDAYSNLLFFHFSLLSDLSLLSLLPIFERPNSWVKELSIVVSNRQHFREETLSLS